MRGFCRLLRNGMLVMTSWALCATSIAAQGDDGFAVAKPEDIQTENLPATPFVFAAYALVWIVVTLYVLSLWRRISKTEREIATVAARLETRGR